MIIAEILGGLAGIVVLVLLDKFVWRRKGRR